MIRLLKPVRRANGWREITCWREIKPEVKPEPEVKSEPEVETPPGCHVMGPYKKGKFVCNPLTKRCRVACRRKYFSIYNEYNELKCLNGKWMTYRSSELVGTGLNQF